MIAIIGAHISGEDDAAFATAEVSIEDLWLWAASPVFEAFLNTSKGKIDGSWALSSKPVEEQLVTVDGTSIALRTLKSCHSLLSARVARSAKA